MFLVMWDVTTLPYCIGFLARSLFLGSDLDSKGDDQSGSRLSFGYAFHFLKHSFWDFIAKGWLDVSRSSISR